MSAPINVCRVYVYAITRSRHESKVGHTILIDASEEEHLTAKFCAPFAYITTVNYFALHLSIPPIAPCFRPA